MGIRTMKTLQMSIISTPDGWTWKITVRDSAGKITATRLSSLLYETPNEACKACQTGNRIELFLELLKY